MSDFDLPMQMYYSARAQEYDRVYEKPERQADIFAVKKWLPSRFLGTRVLEVACGTGFWTQFIAPVTSAMVALDSAPETLQIAKSRVSSRKVKFIVGDAYTLPEDQGPFTGAFAGFWFSHVPLRRQREFLEGLGTVLAPGARVVLLDNFYVEGSDTPIAERDADGNTYQLRQLDDGSTHRVLKNFPTESELMALVVGIGNAAVYKVFKYYWSFEYVVAESLQVTPAK